MRICTTIMTTSPLHRFQPQNISKNFAVDFIQNPSNQWSQSTNHAAVITVKVLSSRFSSLCSGVPRNIYTRYCCDCDTLTSCEVEEMDPNQQNTHSKLIFGKKVHAICVWLWQLNKLPKSEDLMKKGSWGKERFMLQSGSKSLFPEEERRNLFWKEADCAFFG